MNVRSLVVIGAAAGLLALFIIGPPERDEAPPITPYLERTSELSLRLSHAVARWSAGSVLDSTGTAAPASWPAESLVVTFSGFRPQDSTSEAIQLLRRIWSGIKRPNPLVRVRTTVYNARPYFAYDRWFGPYSGSSITRSGPYVVCTAIIGGRLALRPQVSVYESTLDDTMGPCLLLAEFGPPGQGVGQWLAATRFAPARSNAWLRRPRQFLDGDRGTPWMPAYLVNDWDISSAGGLDVVGLARTAAWMLSPPYHQGAQALRCLNGDEAACASAVRQPVGLSPDVPEDLTYGRGLAARAGGRNTLFTPRILGEWFLSDLIREEGRERFAKFWTSDLPLETAFREAFGRDLGAWTRWWAARQYSGSWAFIESGQTVVLGTNLKPSWLLLVLAWTTFAVLIAALTARRRQA